MWIARAALAGTSDLDILASCVNGSMVDAIGSTCACA
jgi:hypothetical protein